MVLDTVVDSTLRLEVEVVEVVLRLVFRLDRENILLLEVEVVEVVFRHVLLFRLDVEVVEVVLRHGRLYMVEVVLRQCLPIRSGTCWV